MSCFLVQTVMTTLKSTVHLCPDLVAWYIQGAYDTRKWTLIRYGIIGVNSIHTETGEVREIVLMDPDSGLVVIREPISTISGYKRDKDNFHIFTNSCNAVVGIEFSSEKNANVCFEIVMCPHKRESAVVFETPKNLSKNEISSPVAFNHIACYSHADASSLMNELPEKKSSNSNVTKNRKKTIKKQKGTLRRKNTLKPEKH